MGGEKRWRRVEINKSLLHRQACSRQSFWSQEIEMKGGGREGGWRVFTFRQLRKLEVGGSERSSSLFWHCWKNRFRWGSWHRETGPCQSAGSICSKDYWAASSFSGRVIAQRWTWAVHDYQSGFHWLLQSETTFLFFQNCHESTQPWSWKQSVWAKQFWMDSPQSRNLARVLGKSTSRWWSLIPEIFHTPQGYKCL